jgi:hypothetical protein
MAGNIVTYPATPDRLLMGDLWVRVPWPWFTSRGCRSNMGKARAISLTVTGWPSPFFPVRSEVLQLARCSPAH